MRARRSSNAVFAERQNTVERMHLAGRSTDEIAARLGVDPTTVSRALRVVQVVTTRTQRQCGNPAFLSNLRWCMELTCRLWDMDKSVKPPINLERYDAMIAAMKATMPDAPDKAEGPCAA